jgi:predicted nucleic acid-binding protein
MRAGEAVLVDTGPLVAIFDPSDRDHQACTAALGALSRSRLVTSLAVLTEASHLLAFSPDAQRSVIEFAGAGAIEVTDFDAGSLARSAALMKKYEDLPMDLADATLVVLAERLGTTQIFTLDRQDFSVYRIGRKAFKILPE